MNDIYTFKEFLEEARRPYELPADTPLNSRWTNITLGMLATRNDSLGRRARAQLEINRKRSEILRQYHLQKARAVKKPARPQKPKTKFENFYDPEKENLKDRMVAKIEPLAEDMLSNIPPKVWRNPKSTFLDFSMAGGQFIKKIVENLQSQKDANGKRLFTDENISERVFGAENDEVAVDLMQDYKIPGSEKTLDNLRNFPYTSILQGRLPRKWQDMKFDVVVGNPPYTSVEKSVAGVTGTIGDKTLYRKFTTKAFDLAKPGGYVSLITLKNVLPHLNQLNKQVDIVNLMTNEDYWKYNTLYFVARNEDRNSPYKIQDKVYDKIFTENGWDIKVQPHSLMQLERGGIVGRGGVRSIVRLPGEKGGIKRDLVPAHKAVLGPKLVFPMLYGSAMNPEANIATDEPILASCSCWIPTRTVRDAQKLRKFILNNPVLQKYIEDTKFNRAPGLALKNLKTFNISQIKTGHEIPKEWKLTKEDLKSLGVE